MGAAIELRKALEDVGVKMSGEALDFMKHAGRVMVKGKDIKQGINRVVRV